MKFAKLSHRVTELTTPIVRNGRKFVTAQATATLVLREMLTRYGRSPGGFVWAVIEPLAAILLLSVGFSLLLRTPPIGTSFILFYATGFLPFFLYNSIAEPVSSALKFSRAFLAYPVVVWLDAIFARFILNLLTTSVVAFILLTAIILVTDANAVINPLAAILAMMLAALMGLSIGCLNCALIGLFPVWERIWKIVTRPLFLASGVIFMYEDMPPEVQQILWYNPLLHIAGFMREGFYAFYEARYGSVLYVCAVSLSLLALGLMLLRRHHRQIVANY